MKRVVKFFLQKAMISMRGFYGAASYGSIYYHDVVAGEGDSFNTINIEKFREQMLYLHDSNYKSLIFSDFNKQNIQKDRSVLITFDDGYKSNFELVFPIMKELKIKFNIFLEVGAIGEKENYLTWDMVREMHESGIVGFGAHTFNHVDSRFIDAHNYDEEIQGVNSLLEKKLGFKVQDYCFPFGAYNERITKHLADKRAYDRLYTSDGRKDSLVGGAWLMGRVGIDDGDIMKVFIQKLEGKFDLYYRLMRSVKYSNNEYIR